MVGGPMRFVCAFALVLVVLPGFRAFAQITCPSALTKTGTSADDVLVGTSHDDRIAGYGGRDTIHGGAGSDCLFGGSQDDKLFGEDGNDQLIGEGGNDLLSGGPGDDVLNGGSNNDTLIGGPGTDTVFGEGGDDIIVIHAGDVPAGQVETLDGGDGNDTARFDFDPGPVVLPNFTVVDPLTGGTYRFVNIERVVKNACGNGVVEIGEQCDDGNRTSGDGCDANCTPTGCGNGIVTDGEECDDGNTSAGDGCAADCRRECGNGTLEGAEECDDGNAISGDGCDENCTLTRCGNGVITTGEECDDGNTVGGDGCAADCRRECGNGILEGAEECDDGNTVDGDGCSATCRHECTTAAQCPTGTDPCAAPACRAGLCETASLPPFPDAICRVGVLARLAECAHDRLPPRFALGRRIKKVQGLLGRASARRQRSRLLFRAERVLALLGAHNARLAGRGRISLACTVALEQHIAELEAAVSGLRSL
jgi:cysteine-rich repeat protein